MKRTTFLWYNMNVRRMKRLTNKQTKLSNKEAN